MLYRALIALLLACLCAAPAAAQSKKEQPKKEAVKKEPAAASASDPVVARVNGVAIHRSELLVMRTMLPSQAQQQPMDQLYPRLLDQAISLALVTEAARKARIVDDPGIKIRMQLAQEQIIQDAYFGDTMRKEITQEKLRARYDQYIKAEPTREEVDARHILVPTEAEAKEIIAELNKGADFATLAKEKTTDPAGKASGGDLGWFSKQDMVPEFADAAFKLKKGQYTETPVKTQFGWHVIKVEDRRQGTPPTYEQIAPKLAQQMAQEIAGARIKELAAASKIEVFQADGSPLPPHPPQGEPRAGAPAAGAPVAGAPQLAPAGLPGAPPANVPTLAPATENLDK